MTIHIEIQLSHTWDYWREEIEENTLLEIYREENKEKWSMMNVIIRVMDQKYWQKLDQTQWG